MKRSNLCADHRLLTLIFRFERALCSELFRKIHAVRAKQKRRGKIPRRLQPLQM
jgi:hypothetical protein